MNKNTFEFSLEAEEMHSGAAEHEERAEVLAEMARQEAFDRQFTEWNGNSDGSAGLD